MDDFPLRHGNRIGIETTAGAEESDGESEEGGDMVLDENENEANDGDEHATNHLGLLQKHLLEAKNARVVRHLTDLSNDRADKHQRALTQATRPLYFAIGRALGIDLPVRGSKLELHDIILSSVSTREESRSSYGNLFRSVLDH
jgi:hypothetical protein